MCVCSMHMEIRGQFAELVSVSTLWVLGCSTELQAVFLPPQLRPPMEINHTCHMQ